MRVPVHECPALGLSFHTRVGGTEPQSQCDVLLNLAALRHGCCEPYHQGNPRYGHARFPSLSALRRNRAPKTVTAKSFFLAPSGKENSILEVSDYAIPSGGYHRTS